LIIDRAAGGKATSFHVDWRSSQGAMQNRFTHRLARHRRAADLLTTGLVFSALLAMALAAYLVFGSP
jgi:hypothetical protein